MQCFTSPRADLSSPRVRGSRPPPHGILTVSSVGRRLPLFGWAEGNANSDDLRRALRHRAVPHLTPARPAPAPAPLHPVPPRPADLTRTPGRAQHSFGFLTARLRPPRCIPPRRAPLTSPAPPAGRSIVSNFLPRALRSIASNLSPRAARSVCARMPAACGEILETMLRVVCGKKLETMLRRARGSCYALDPRPRTGPQRTRVACGEISGTMPHRSGAHGDRPPLRI
jgi:hypothetical protein